MQTKNYYINFKNYFTKFFCRKINIFGAANNAKKILL